MLTVPADRPIRQCIINLHRGTRHNNYNSTDVIPSREVLSPPRQNIVLVCLCQYEDGIAAYQTSINFSIGVMVWCVTLARLECSLLVIR